MNKYIAMNLKLKKKYIADYFETDYLCSDYHAGVTILLTGRGKMVMKLKKEEKDDFDKYLEEQMKDPEFKKAYIAEIENRIKDLLTGKSKVISEKEARKRLNWHKKKKKV